MDSIEKGLDALLNDDPVVPLPTSIWGNSAVHAPITPPRPDHHTQSMAFSSPWGSPTHSTTVDPTPTTTATATNKPTPNKPTPDASTTELAPKKREVPPPKRVWTHYHEQPGQIHVDRFNGQDESLVLYFGPREELVAHWSLPLAYLRSKSPRASLEAALEGLTVGLFRRGCTENGLQASIISKAVLGDDNRSYDYWVENQTVVRGKVPFFSPRTPGNVLFRLYWEKEPLETLAMGPTMLVRVLERDFESSVRFILSNFKGKKSNPTSLSSLHSLATVLEAKLSRPNESAARATWGCIQEARKVMDACASEYVKTTSKLVSLEETVEELKQQVEEENETKSSDNDVEGEESEAASTLKEKMRALMSGRASCERKWRDSQLAFAAILRAVVTNPTAGTLLRRELITRMRIELELWCPLSEEFAIPGDEYTVWYEALRELPQTIAGEHFQAYAQARIKMQMRTLAFEPNTVLLEDALFPRNHQAPQQRAMDKGAVNVFNTMSSAMGQYYQSTYMNMDEVNRRRELIRQKTEACVRDCGAFPPGTSVLIFGSSANGFGSPKSDIDMCLHIPDGSKFLDGDSSSEAMTKLAEHMKESGMQDVDTARLTARIPIIQYQCPDPLSDSSDVLIECDISMHNPLAVLNTALLRNYAEITPITQVLASVIKRWAKARDINNPARHTLSSYGYIVMLLHFLTYHKRDGNGLVSPVAPAEGTPEFRNPANMQPTPLLPNLQWIDPMWTNLPKRTPYRELPALPKDVIPHPLEDKKDVNVYFYKPKTPNEKALLQMVYSGQDLSLAILLASFFRYYAYEFDYKRHVVSLHSTGARGLVEREVKAELEGWRNYSAALTIEDPFETGYDIAHVLRGGYYHRIRREFTIAYSKIADAACGRAGSWEKGDLRAMSGDELLDWICEPVGSEKEA